LSRYKIIIEYDGTEFVGWQRQDNGLSVQEVIEEALYKFSGQKTTIYGAGRTDSGVHALGQVAHFDLETHHFLPSIQSAINYFIKPHKISIIYIEMVDAHFHARFSALNKTYVYKICDRKAPLVFMRGYAWSIKKPLVTSTMREAATLLIGKHDFSSFRSVKCQATSPIRTIDNITIEEHGELRTISVTAKSFLHNQVRIIAGGLCYVGIGKWTIAQFQEALASCDRTRGPITAPPYGLFLVEVRY
jgi:tRNA pseudouridine38-40 synthase